MIYGNTKLKFTVALFMCTSKEQIQYVTLKYLCQYKNGGIYNTDLLPRSSMYKRKF